MTWKVNWLSSKWLYNKNYISCIYGYYWNGKIIYLLKRHNIVRTKAWSLAARSVRLRLIMTCGGNWRQQSAYAHCMKDRGYITFPKLPFPMARNIWKWSKFTVRKKREKGREKEAVSTSSATFKLNRKSINTETPSISIWFDSLRFDLKSNNDDKVSAKVLKT